MEEKDRQAIVVSRVALIVLHLLCAGFLLLCVARANAEETKKWHEQPMNTWHEGECSRSPNATSYRNDGDHPVQLPEDASLEDRARAAGYRLSVTEIDSWGRIKPEHQEHWRKVLGVPNSRASDKPAKKTRTAVIDIPEERKTVSGGKSAFCDCAKCDCVNCNCCCAKSVKLSKSELADASYVCSECGWTPWDDGSMNRAGTFEPLVAAMRITNHAYDHHDSAQQNAKAVGTLEVIDLDNQMYGARNENDEIRELQKRIRDLETRLDRALKDR